MPGVNQVLCGQIRALLLAADDPVVFRRIQVTGHEHIGDTRGLHALDGAPGAAAGEQQDAVHLAADGGFHHLQFQLRVIPGAEDEQRIAIFRGDVLDGIGHDAIVGVAHAADDDAQRLGVPGAQ